MSFVGDISTALDGTHIKFGCAPELIPADWQWNARLSSRVSGVGLSVVTRDQLEVMPFAATSELTEQVTYLGRPLSLQQAPDDEGWVAIWAGSQHAIIMGMTTKPDLAPIVDLLQTVWLNDKVAGLTIQPRQSETSLSLLQGRRYVAGVGPVTAFPRDASQSLVPPGTGKPVSNGAVWQISIETGGKQRGQKWLHVGSSVVLTVDDALGVDPNVNERNIENFLQTVEARWAHK
jgi:hypothetical protein